MTEQQFDLEDLQQMDAEQAEAMEPAGRRPCFLGPLSPTSNG